MTRPHDRSLPGRCVSVPSVGASDATNSTSAATEDDTASPPEVPAVLVPYQQFIERRELRRRMMAAFARLERQRTIDGEVVGSVTVDNGKAQDET